MQYKIKLTIADVVIQMQSYFPFQRLTEQRQNSRFKNFFYSGERNPDILINIEIVDKFPKVFNAKSIFITHHFQNGAENWRLLKKNNEYIYKSPVRDKKQLIFINKSFNRVTAYLLPKEEKSQKGVGIKANKRFIWNVSDIIYDFLQILLINYFAKRNLGIFTHSVGIKDLDKEGLLFTGKSGCGKTTSARLWDKHSKAMVLNDDRIIVRRLNGKFFIYGSPWHGDFSDYLNSRIESAQLKRIFFIHHARDNIARKINQKGSFILLYPSLFPTFWDKACLEGVVSFAQDLVRDVACYNLGFVNDKRIIGFVRNYARN